MNEEIKCYNCGKTNVPLITKTDYCDVFYECESCHQIGLKPKQHRWDCINGSKHGAYKWKYRFKYQRCNLLIMKDLPICVCEINNGCGHYHSGGIWKKFWQIIFRKK